MLGTWDNIWVLLTCPQAVLTKCRSPAGITEAALKLVPSHPGEEPAGREEGFHWAVKAAPPHPMAQGGLHSCAWLALGKHKSVAGAWGEAELGTQSLYKFILWRRAEAPFKHTNFSERPWSILIIKRNVWVKDQKTFKMLHTNAMSLQVPRAYTNSVPHICNKIVSICLADVLESCRVQIYHTHQDANPKFHLALSHW